MTLGAAGKMKFGVSILVIPDAHARPDENLSDFDRFVAVGKLIEDLRPDVVISLGDLGDFASLAQHDKPAGAPAFDGRALDRDVGCFRDALRALTSPTRSSNDRALRARHKERVYSPRWILLEGNHEERWRRRPELAGGLLGHDYLRKEAAKLGWEWAPFLDPIELYGVLFSHYVTTGVSKQPAGLRQILAKTHRSCVVGHTHSWGLDQQPVLGKRTISALVAGCFKPPHRTGEHEWSGLTLLTGVNDGAFSVQQLPYDAIMERYGEGDYAQTLRNERAQGSQDHEDAEFAFS